MFATNRSRRAAAAVVPMLVIWVPIYVVGLDRVTTLVGLAVVALTAWPVRKLFDTRWPVELDGPGSSGEGNGRHPAGP